MLSSGHVLTVEVHSLKTLGMDPGPQAQVRFLLHIPKKQDEFGKQRPSRQIQIHHLDVGELPSARGPAAQPLQPQSYVPEFGLRLPLLHWGAMRSEYKYECAIR